MDPSQRGSTLKFSSIFEVVRSLVARFISRGLIGIGTGKSFNSCPPLPQDLQACIVTVSRDASAYVLLIRPLLVQKWRFAYSLKENAIT